MQDHIGQFPIDYVDLLLLHLTWRNDGGSTPGTVGEKAVLRSSEPSRPAEWRLVL